MAESMGKIRAFLKGFGIVGGIYLLSWPFIVAFAELFLPNYMHREIITFI